MIVMSEMEADMLKRYRAVVLMLCIWGYFGLILLQHAYSWPRHGSPSNQTLWLTNKEHV